MTTVPPRWTIVVPVKATDRGKSRIDLQPRVRRRLALAMAMDTVSAAAQCAAVLAVVESESDAAALQQIAGVQVHRTGVLGLNESILDGLAVLGACGIIGHVAVLPGDLPGLRPADLSAALTACESHPFSVVADHQGVGSTLLAATTARVLIPRYGADSYCRHQDAGAVPVPLPASSSLRRDVDMVSDLLDLQTLDPAVGARTRAVLADLPPSRAGRDRFESASQQVGDLPGVHGVTVERCTANSSDPGGSSGT